MFKVKSEIMKFSKESFKYKLTTFLLVLLPLSIFSKDLEQIWIECYSKTDKDTYVAFRGEFQLEKSKKINFKILGASWFNAWLDNRYFTEGPARFPAEFPEYEVLHKKLSEGKHVISFIVHYEGVVTRILDDIKPFLSCQLYSGGKRIEVKWKAIKMDGYLKTGRRINPQLGWVEWLDTEKFFKDWKKLEFDDSSWKTPIKVDVGIGKAKPLSIASVKQFNHSLEPIASGTLTETFGYELDDPPARFFMRKFDDKEMPAQGVWRRYDLGRVRLGRPNFSIDLPKNAIVEFAYSETLSNNRVTPFITLSAGKSCNLDHFRARGGTQTFFPLSPKGGRYLEIHVLAAPEQVEFITEEFVERGYYGESQGSFNSNDELLNKIWETGIETFRACTEDALVDNPTRERGQWTGDAVSVGLDIASAGYHDVRLVKRALMQAAQCAREDGLVAGLSPGGEAYLATYAAQWVSAVMHYWELTGDKQFLIDMYPYALANLKAYNKYFTDNGLIDGIGWVFVDWGYFRNDGPIDIAYNLHFYKTLKDMIRWCKIMGDKESEEKHIDKMHKLHNILSSWFDACVKDASGWKEIGYHSLALGLKFGFIQNDKKEKAISFIKKHILSSFPNKYNAPRLCDPGFNNRQLITPYFAHFSFPTLIENGEIDFVLDQYRKTWGWSLQNGRTTWVEVFDTRWSHAHQWAGAPTWQLSRYVLGLQNRFDLGHNHFQFSLYPGNLNSVSGKIPLSSNSEILVVWEKMSDGIHITITTPETIYLHLDTDFSTIENIIKIKNKYTEVIKY